MTVRATIDGSVAQLTVSGRISTDNSRQFAAQVDSLLACLGPFSSLVCHAGGLEYISSSGLRVMLALAKRYPDFRITDVQPDVYQVFDVTGFTKLMTVERVLRSMSVDGCQVIGRGGVGVVYRIDDDTIIKVFREGTTLDEVRTEINLSKAAFVLGMPTAISYDIVRLGSQYGLVYELLRADTLSASILRRPHDIDAYARLYAQLFHQLHAISVPRGSGIPDAMVRERDAIRRISRYFDPQSVDLLLRIVDSIPRGNRLLHCDLQTKNAMVQGGELMLIDMGEVGYGHPIVDLGHASSAMMSLIGDYEAIVGLPQRYANDVWQRMVGYYFEGEPADVVAHRLEQIDVVSRVRNFAWLSLSDSFPPALVRQCQDAFSQRVASRKDYIFSVCETLSDWKV